MNKTKASPSSRSDEIRESHLKSVRDSMTKGDHNTVPSPAHDVVEAAAHRIYDAVRPHSRLAYWLCEKAAEAALASVPAQQPDSVVEGDTASMQATRIAEMLGEIELAGWRFRRIDGDEPGPWKHTGLINRPTLNPIYKFETEPLYTLIREGTPRCGQ